MKRRVIVLPLVIVSAIAACVIPRVSADIASSKLLLDEGRIPEAITELREATTQDPKNADAWGWLGDAYLRSAKFDSAAAAAQTLVELKDDWSLGYALLARAELAQGDPKAAAEAVKKGLKKSEKRRGMKKESGSPILTAQGLVLLASDSTDQAVIALTQAREEDPANALAVEALGDAYFKKGIPALAVVQYETAVRMDSTDATRNYKLAQAYLKDHRFNDAARSYEQSIRLNPENTQAVFDLAKIYVASKHYTEAVPILGEYVKREPGSVDGWTLYMQALDHTNHPEELATASRKVLEFQPNSTEALRTLAHAQAELRQPEDAIRSYQQLAAQDTLTAEDHRMLGKAYAQNGQDSLAVASLEAALSLMGEGQVDLYSDLGIAYMRLKMFEQASGMFEKRFQADSTAVGAYLNYGLCNMFLKKWDLAGPALRKVVEMKPDYVTGYTYLAKYYGNADSTRQALATYQKVIEMVTALPDSAQTRYQKDVADAYGQIGITHLIAKPPRLPEALDALTKAIKIKDDDPQTHLWRAQTLYMMGRYDEARQEYKAVLKLDPKNETARKDLEKLDQVKKAP